MRTTTRKKAGFRTLLVLIALMFSTVPVFALTDGDNVITDPDKFSSWHVLGPTGGDVRVVVIDPKDKNRLYISTLDGQIYKSEDAGKSWRLLVNLNEPQLILDQLMVDSRDSNVIYTSGHRHKSPGGFFRTTDGGATWTEAKELKNEAIHSMTQSASDPDILFVGTTGGVWVSKNSGESWEKISSDTMPVNINSMAVDPRNTSTIYAGTWWRPYKSTDSGKSWKLIKNGLIDDSDIFAISINSRNPQHLVASACSGIYETYNGGEKWAKIQGIPSQSRRTRDIVQHPSLPGTIYAATTEGFWMSSNGGKTWIMTTQRNLEINSIAVHPDEPNRVFIGTNNWGVMVSNDGGQNFTPTNDSFTSRFTYSITPDTSQPDRLYATTHNTATGGGFFFTSSDAGSTWQQAKNLDVNRVSPFSVLQDRTDPTLMLLGTSIGIYRSADRGTSWTFIAPPKPVKKRPVRRSARTKKKAPAPKAKTAAPAAPEEPKLIPAITDKVRVLTYTEDGTNAILAGTDKGLYRTNDLTKGWEKIALGEGVNDNIFVIYISPQRPETIWVGTASSGVLVSHDSGKTWATAEGVRRDAPISSIVVDPKRPDYVYVGSTQSLYRSRDGGKTWIGRGKNLPLGNYTSMLINPQNTDEIFLSSSLESDGGIFFSSDAGDQWKRVDSKDMKIPSRRVWSMAFDPQNSNRIFAGSHSSGVYLIERTISTASKETQARPRIIPDGN